MNEVPARTAHNVTTADGRLLQEFDDAAHCAACGACCRTLRVSFYHGEIAGPWGGSVPAELTLPLTPHIVCMKGTEFGNGPCIALTDAGRCAIYDRRPSTCREFLAFLPDGRANPECERLRRRTATEC
jgi:hypothetical protein